MMIRIKPITVRERRRGTGVFYYHCLLVITYYIILLLCYIIIVRQQCDTAVAATAYDDPKPATMTTALRTWSLIGQQWVMWYGVMLNRPRVCVSVRVWRRQRRCSLWLVRTYTKPALPAAAAATLPGDIYTDLLCLAII